MRYFILSLFIAVTSIHIVAQEPSKEQNQRYFDINKNIDIFNSVLRELDMFYVDSVEVNNLVQRTIESMLTRLDPYTEYYSEENIGDLQFLTTGEYAGVGAIISYKDGGVIINEPYEGLPADKAGLKAGDRILEIDEEDVRSANVRDVSNKLKGTPGTTLQLLIKRPGEERERVVSVIREKIEMDPITFSEIVKDDIGYLHFGSFTSNSSKRVEETVK